MMMHYIFYLIFALGVLIEIISIYLDYRIMTGKGKTSGAWGVAFGFFVIFGTYGALLGNRPGEPFMFTNELKVVLIVICFQIFFHVIYPILRIYCSRSK